MSRYHSGIGLCAVGLVLPSVSVVLLIVSAISWSSFTGSGICNLVEGSVFGYLHWQLAGESTNMKILSSILLFEDLGDPTGLLIDVPANMSEGCVWLYYSKSP
jgi:hypothetical protein